MIIVRKLVLGLGLLGALGFILFGQLTAVNAQSDICEAGSSAYNSAFCVEQRKTDDPLTEEGGIMSKIINFISYMVGIVSVFVLIIGGYRITFSHGEATSVQGGRNMVIYALVGLVVVGLAQAIVVLVLDRL